MAGILFAQILFLLGHCSTLWRIICTNNFSDNSGILFAIVFFFDWRILITPLVSSISDFFLWIDCDAILSVFQRISSMYYGLLDKLLKFPTSVDEAIGMGFLIVPGRIATIINNTVFGLKHGALLPLYFFPSFWRHRQHIEDKGEISVYDR